MINYSSELTDGQKNRLLADGALALAERSSYFSDIDGCFVVPVKCFKCGERFEEELAAAREKIIKRFNFVCLQCDPQSSLTADISGGKR